MDNFCCIDSIELLENTHYRKYSIWTNSNEEGNKEYSRVGMPLPSSELKTLPVIDMRASMQKNPNEKITTISKLPISTKNIVRRVSGNPSDYYSFLKRLGHGTFGEVYKVMQKASGNIRAMKIIPKNNMRPGFADKDIINEINIMKNLGHPHIIKIFEFFCDNKNYYLINEYCTEGDLSEKLMQLKHLPEPIVKILMAQIFQAVLYLNNRGIIHGDLKLENILVDSYYDDGHLKKSKKGSFINSLVEDAKNVKDYLRNVNMKRVNTSVVNLKSLHEKLRLFKEKDKSDKVIPKNSKKYLFENINNIIQEDSREFDINIEEKKNDYEPEKKEEKERKEESNIFGFQSNDDDEDEDKKNNSDDSNEDNDSSDFCKSPNNNQNQSKNIPNFQLNNSKKDILMNNNSSEIKLGLDNDEEAQDRYERKINKKLTYNYNKLNIKNFELKLIDFGCSKMFSAKRKTTFEDTIGTLVYCSPEVLKNNYDQKCDIWSCGVIMYLLLCGRFPFYGKSEEEITNKILFSKLNFNNKLFENVSESAKDLITKCLIRDKNKRISVKEALKHEFFSSELDIKNIFENKVVTNNVLNNIKKNARKTSKFYQIVLTYLSYNFADKEHINKMKDIFYKIDLNMDGKLSRDELFLAYKEAKIDITKEELNKIIKCMDFDGNGFIEFEEFIRVTLPKEQLFTDINLKNAFDMFDKDKNGTISIDEIIEVIGAELDKNAIEELKKEVSYDGDKEIDFKHFKEFMLGLKNKND